MGLSAVVEEGIVVVCSEINTLPTADSALKQLAREEDVPSASHTIRGQHSADAVAAAQLLAAREQANLFLLSQLEEDVVSELGFAPVEEAADIDRLCNRCESCILISSAQFADTHAVNAS